MTTTHNINHRLASAKWFAFDLDDTLHSFRAASSTATTSTLNLLTTQHPSANLSLNHLQAEYRAILKQGTSTAFVDGKSSHTYREARISALLQNVGLQANKAQMSELLICYESTLTQALQLKPGTIEFLTRLKSIGKKIAILTEGPQDAQERTIRALGLDDFVDYLGTTNRIGVSKVDGLYARVVEVLDVGAHEVVMVGDSWERDVKPAREVGMGCVWVDWDGEGFGERGERGVMKVGGMVELLEIVENV